MCRLAYFIFKNCKLSWPDLDIALSLQSLIHYTTILYTMLPSTFINLSNARSASFISLPSNTMMPSILTFDLTMTWPVIFEEKLKNTLYTFRWDSSIVTFCIGAQWSVLDIVQGSGSTPPPHEAECFTPKDCQCSAILRLVTVRSLSGYFCDSHNPLLPESARRN